MPGRAGGAAAILAAAALWGSTGTVAHFAPAGASPVSVTTTVAYLLYGRGLRTVPAPVAVTLGLAEPVVAALLALVVLGERLSVPAVAGLILVGLALAILIMPGGQDSRAVRTPGVTGSVNATRPYAVNAPVGENHWREAAQGFSASRRARAGAGRFPVGLRVLRGQAQRG